MNETKRTIRCAIYTRKSSEEGLEQEFNSLDAQYEACSAYIVSQKSEGWPRQASAMNRRSATGTARSETRSCASQAMR